MRKTIIGFIAIASMLTGCATVQSLVRSTFPYTSTLVIPASSRTGTTLSATSSANSFDQIFTGQGSNTESVKEIRIASAKIEASNPSNQSLGVIKSIKMYISRGDGSSEVLVASRTDIASTAGNSLVLDIDNSRFLDDYIKGSTVRVRMEYVLRESINVDASVKASLGFSVAPATR
ncbi:hypothetical protein [Daejeonella oryzae]|uniref:hypothetical protein n=1 Tax=Daejeonella oryzae TaxID=1122943 RepID=UPI000414C5F2|nr:hypothetical protein [Daejeonella oryzae]